MPLVGIVLEDEVKVSSFDVLEEARKEGVAYGYPLAFWVDALKERHLKGYSVTELVGDTLRQKVIQRLFDYYDEPKSMWARLRGTWLHSGAATAMEYEQDAGWLIERRLFADLDGVEISGQIDAYHQDSGRLIDFKSTKFMPPEPYDSHLYQLGAYRWLIEDNFPDEPVTAVYVVYMTWGDIYMKVVDRSEDKTWETSTVLETMRMGMDILQEGDEYGIIPPKLFCNERLCPYCAVRNICESLPEGRTKL